MPNTGRYWRNLHNERARRVGVQLQASQDGQPTYIVDTDFREMSDVHRTGIQRLAQTIHPGGAFIGDSFKVVQNVDAGDRENNFLILGRRDEAAEDVVGVETCAAGYVGGQRVTLFRSTDFDCVVNDGAFSSNDAAAIHRKFTSAAAGYIDDHRAKFTPNALTGLTVRLYDGDYVVTGNTENRILLAGYLGNAIPAISGDRFYWIKLRNVPVGGEDLEVFIDVHVEDWGVEDNADFNHNPGGSVVEACRRLKLIQQVFIDYPPAAGQHSQPVTHYVDNGGFQHYVIGIGAIARDEGDNDVNNADIEDDRDEGAGVGEQVREARLFSRCVKEDPLVDDTERALSLRERLDREVTWTSVGPDGNKGVHYGNQGLLDALACDDIRVIYLRTGAYTYVDTEMTISAGKRIYAEDGANIVLAGTASRLILRDDTEIFGAKISIRNDAEAAISLQGDKARLVDCQITAFPGGAAHTQPLIKVTGRRTLIDRCFIQSAGATAVIVELPQGTPPTALQAEAGGMVIRECRFNGEDISPGSYAIDLTSGMGILIESCTIVSQGGCIRSTFPGNSALHTAAPSNMNDLVLTNNRITGQVSDLYAGTTLVDVSTSDALIQGNVIGFEEHPQAGAGSPLLPSRTVLVRPAAGLTGRVIFRDNRCTMAQVGLVYISAVEFSEAIISGNFFVPYVSGPGTGVLATGNTSKNAVIVSDNLFSFRTVTATVGVGAEGHVVVRRNTVVGAGIGVDVGQAAPDAGVDVVACRLNRCSTGVRIGERSSRVLVDDCFFDLPSGRAIDIALPFGGTQRDIAVRNCYAYLGATSGGFLKSLTSTALDLQVTDCWINNYASGGAGLAPMIEMAGRISGVQSKCDVLRDHVKLLAEKPNHVEGCNFEAGQAGIVVTTSAVAYISHCHFHKMASVAGFGGVHIDPAAKGYVRGCTFFEVDSYGVYNSGLAEVTECRFEKTGQHRANEVAVRNLATALVRDCYFEFGGDILAQTFVWGSGGDFQVVGCEFRVNGGNVILAADCGKTEIVRNKIDSARTHKDAAFVKSTRAIYVNESAVGSTIVIRGNEITGDGISAELTGADPELVVIEGNRMTGGFGIWCFGEGWQVLGNFIHLSTLLVGSVIDGSGIWYGSEKESLSDGIRLPIVLHMTAADAGASVPRIENNTISSYSEAGNDWTVDAIGGRAGLIVAQADGVRIVGNTLESAGFGPRNAIIVGNVNQRHAGNPETRVGLVMGCLIARNTLSGQAKMVLCLEEGGTSLIKDNTWNAFRTDAQALADPVYIFYQEFETLGSHAVVRFTGNEVFVSNSSRFSINQGHSANYWGLVRASKMMDIDGANGNIAVEPWRIRSHAVGVEVEELTGTSMAPEAVTIDALQLLNNFARGADLD